MSFDFDFFAKPKTNIQKRTDKYLDQSFKIIKLLNDNFDIPGKNEVLNIVTKKTFNAFNFIHLFIEKFNVIEELTVSTYSINKSYIHLSINLLDTKKIESMNLIFNDNIDYRNKENANYIRNILRDSKINYKTNDIHAKIYLLKSKNNYIIITGSGNWNINANIENYVIFNNKNIYDFYYKELLSIEMKQR